MGLFTNPEDIHTGFVNDAPRQEVKQYGLEMCAASDGLGER